MKILLALIALNFPLYVRAEDDLVRDRPVKGDEEKAVQDPLIVRALTLKRKMSTLI
jgi:hypothetical protein